MEKERSILAEFIQPARIDLIKQEAQQCWAVLRKIRSSSLCFACSANSYQYYRGKLGLVSEDTCETVISACKAHMRWLRLVRFQVDGLAAHYAYREFKSDPVFVAAFHSSRENEKKYEGAHLKDILSDIFFQTFNFK